MMFNIIKFPKLTQMAYKLLNLEKMEINKHEIQSKSEEKDIKLNDGD